MCRRRQTLPVCMGRSSPLKTTISALLSSVGSVRHDAVTHMHHLRLASFHILWHRLIHLVFQRHQLNSAWLISSKWIKNTDVCLTRCTEHSNIRFLHILTAATGKVNPPPTPSFYPHEQDNPPCEVSRVFCGHCRGWACLFFLFWPPHRKTTQGIVVLAVYYSLLSNIFLKTILLCCSKKVQRRWFIFLGFFFSNLKQNKKSKFCLLEKQFNELFFFFGKHLIPTNVFSILHYFPIILIQS